MRAVHVAASACDENAHRAGIQFPHIFLPIANLLFFCLRTHENLKIMYSFLRTSLTAISGAKVITPTVGVISLAPEIAVRLVSKTGSIFSTEMKIVSAPKMQSSTLAESLEQVFELYSFPGHLNIFTRPCIHSTNKTRNHILCMDLKANIGGRWRAYIVVCLAISEAD